MTAFLGELVDLLSGLGRAKVVVGNGGLVFAVKGVPATGFVNRAGVGEWPHISGYLAGLLERLKPAQAYVFENLPCWIGPDGRRRFPDLKEDDVRLFNANILFPPAPECWFEFATSATHRIGLLVDVFGSAVRVWEFDRLVDQNGVIVSFVCYGVSYHRSGDNVPGRHPALAPGVDQSRTCCIVEDPYQHLVRLIEAERLHGGGWQGEDAMAGAVRESLLTLQFMAALHHGDIKVETIKPGRFSNMRRREKGLWALPEHRRIVLPEAPPEAIAF